jgi:hypothetical protein
MRGQNNLAAQVTTESKTKLLAGETLMQTVLTNSKVRKSLSEQIDRLDKILDGLAQALNGAVADAVTQAVSLTVNEAVQTVLTEVLSNPDLRAHLQGSAVAPVAAGNDPAIRSAATSLVNRVAQNAAHLANWCIAQLHALTQLGRRAVQQVGRVATDLLARMQGLRLFVRPLAAALLLGIATGIAAYCAGPWLAGVVGGAGSLSLRLALSVRRFFRLVWDSAILARVRSGLLGLGRWGVV